MTAEENHTLEIFEILEEYRMEKGLNRKDLSLLIGVSPSGTVSHPRSKAQLGIKFLNGILRLSDMPPDKKERLVFLVSRMSSYVREAIRFHKNLNKLRGELSSEDP